MDELIPWSNFHAVGRELEYLTDAFKSGWISGGQYTQRLEKQLDLIFEKSTSLVVSNGTSALQLAFQVIGLEPEDQVIVPSFCFQAASNIIRQLGALPVFCDINPLSWNQSLSTIKQALTPKTKGIVVVHNYGVSAPIEQINSWAKANGLW